MLKRDHGVAPLYYQVQHTIAERIRRGEWAPGAQLPTEVELSRELGVSRVTLREALRVLAEEGVLVKYQGRGTFVSEQALAAQPARKFTSNLEHLYDQLERISVKQVEIARVPLSEDLRERFGLSDEETQLVRVKRVRHVDESPFAFTVNLLPPDIGSHLDEEGLRRQPLLRILEEDLGIEISSAHETIEAAAADAEVAQWLEVPALSPVMHVNRAVYAQGDKLVQLVESFYRSDKYRYSVQLTREQSQDRSIWSAKLNLA